MTAEMYLTSRTLGGRRELTHKQLSSDLYRSFLCVGMCTCTETQTHIHMHIYSQMTNEMDQDSSPYLPTNS